MTRAPFGLGFGTCRLLQFWLMVRFRSWLMWMGLHRSGIDLGACGFGGHAGPPTCSQCRKGSLILRELRPGSPGTAPCCWACGAGPGDSRAGAAVGRPSRRSLWSSPEHRCCALGAVGGGTQPLQLGPRQAWPAALARCSQAHGLQGSASQPGQSLALGQGGEVGQGALRPCVLSHLHRPPDLPAPPLHSRVCLPGRS